MIPQFSIAQLSPELLSELKKLEERIRQDADENVVLIAYTEATEANPSPS